MAGNPPNNHTTNKNHNNGRFKKVAPFTAAAGQGILTKTWGGWGTNLLGLFLFGNGPMNGNVIGRKEEKKSMRKERGRKKGDTDMIGRIGKKKLAFKGETDGN